MGEHNGAEWVEACRAWTARAVIEEMRQFAAAAVSARGAYVAGARESRVPCVSDELVSRGSGSMFVVQTRGRGIMANASGDEVHFESVRDEDEGWGRSPNSIVATLASVKNGERAETTKTARLALDCARGKPCLLVDQEVDGRPICGRGRQVTAQEFVREVLLPVLFPDLVAADHSRDRDKSTGSAAST